ncbi:MAG: glycerol acyltransferase [Deltaproteobacteria bacterium CG_4_10_14_0_2_um_filter_43_8]|nr:MAG: glycerol acyltransferase [Deltaproteobacteria bacterium CG11_big_fil_rev_8_21_14_0_20_42_23]PJA20556.1 MAG: glycerol acyltransferase [Deltaproteobacteria bacterium CG_4_10_14_0_2_um_filter_43_8]PJC64216.1 MAG: glycerol acyltransferase [Deltaproteobacteria bacterium CG_4_9_14_0_2_um_filter_42_21]
MSQPYFTPKRVSSDFLLFKEFLKHLFADFSQSKHFQELNLSFLQFVSSQPEVFKAYQTFSQYIGKSSAFFDELTSDIDEEGKSQNIISLIRIFSQFFYHHYFRVTVKGAEHIPQKKGALFIANHSGLIPFDAGMITCALFNHTKAARQTRYLVDDFVFNLPGGAAFMRLVGGLPASIQNAKHLLSHNEQVLLFPEGVKGLSKDYQHRYQLQSFGRGGFVKLALEHNAPIVPVAVIGAEESSPLLEKNESFAHYLGLPYLPATSTFPWLGPLGLIPLPTKWTIVFGKPIRPKTPSTADLERADYFSAEAEKMKQLLSQMLEKELEQRDTIWE